MEEFYQLSKTRDSSQKLLFQFCQRRKTGVKIIWEKNNQTHIWQPTTRGANDKSNASLTCLSIPYKTRAHSAITRTGG